MKISYEKSDWVPTPTHWTKRYNASSEPCDMIRGACVCGTTHSLEEEWVRSGIIQYGFYDFIVGFSIPDFDFERHDKT